MCSLIPLLKFAQVILVLALEQITVKGIQIPYCITADRMAIGVTLLKKTQILALIGFHLLLYESCG